MYSCFNKRIYKVYFNIVKDFVQKNRIKIKFEATNHYSECMFLVVESGLKLTIKYQES